MEMLGEENFIRQQTKVMLFYSDFSEYSEP